jgi:hypothetical protein
MVWAKHGGGFLWMTVLKEETESQDRGTSGSHGLSQTFSKCDGPKNERESRALRLYSVAKRNQRNRYGFRHHHHNAPPKAQKETVEEIVSYLE